MAGEAQTVVCAETIDRFRVVLWREDGTEQVIFCGENFSPENFKAVFEAIERYEKKQSEAISRRRAELQRIVIVRAVFAEEHLY
jgi:hypothetical protein